MLNGNTGDHSEKLRTSSADSDENLLSTIDGRLKNLADMTGPSKEASDDDIDDSDLEDEEELDDVDDDSTLDDKDDDTDEDDKDDKDDEDDKDDKDDEDDKDDKDNDTEDKTVDIPHAFVQAAIRNGWTEDDVAELIETNPTKAKKILNNIYNSVNQSSREWSMLGRAKLNQTVSSKDDKQTDDSDFAGIDIDKLKAEYEDNVLIDGVIAPLNEALKKMSKDLKAANKPAVNASSTLDRATEIALQQQVTNFFSSDSMKPYNDFYGELKAGESVENLSPQQAKNRWDVLIEADAIMAGYEAIGKKIDPSEAMARAHLLLTEPLRNSIIRDGIKKTVTKRSKSITMRPSKSAKSKSSNSKFSKNSRPRNRQELEASVSQKLQSVFKK